MAEQTGLRHKWILDATQYFREIAKLRGETKAYDKDSDKATDGAGRGFDRVSEKIERTSSTLARLKGRIIGAFAAFSITRIFAEIFKLNASLETVTMQFNQLAGGAERAKKLLFELRQFTATTPFQEGEVFGAARNLLAFGFDPDEVTTTLRRLGDVSSGLKIPLGEIAEIYGKIRVQGRLFQEDINQLLGRGIPIVAALAEQFGVAEDKVRGLVESGQVGFVNIEQAFRQLTETGGQFEGLTAQLATTAEGLISTFKDLISVSAQEIGVGAFDLIKEDLASIVESLSEARESGQGAKVISAISDGLATLYRVLRSGVAVITEHGATIAKIIALFVAWRAGMILTNTVIAITLGLLKGSQAVIGLYAASVQLARAAMFAFTGQTVAAGVAMRSFTTIIKTNPIGLIVSVILTAATAFVLFKNRTDELAKAQRELKISVDQNIKALTDLGGVALRSRDSELFRSTMDLGRERADIAAEIAAAEAELRAITPASGRDALNDIGNVSGNINRFRELSQTLQTLRERERAVLFEVNQANRERDAIQKEVNTNLFKELGYLEQVRDELIAQNGEGQIAGRTLGQVNAEITTLTSKIEALKGAGSGFSVVTPIDKEAERRLERFGELLGKIRDEMRLTAAASDEERASLRDLIAAEEQLTAIREGLADVSGQLTAAQRTQAEAAAKFVEARIDELKGQVQGFKEAARLTIEAGRALETVAPDLLPGAGRLGIAAALDEQVQAFEAQTAELNALRAAGVLSEEAFQKKAEVLANEFRKRLIEILNLLQSMGLVSDEAMSALVRGFDKVQVGAAKHVKSLGEVNSKYGEMSVALRGIIGFARAFGSLDQGTLKLLESTEELFASLQRVADAKRELDDLSNDPNATPGQVAQAQAAQVSGQIATVVAFTQVVGGLVNTYIDERQDRKRFLEQQREEFRRLGLALRDSVRGFQDAVKSLFAGVVGADVTGTQAGAAQGIVDALEAELIRVRESLTGPRGTIDQTRVRDRRNAAGIESLLRDLENTGIDAFENIGDLWESILAASGGDILLATRRLIEGFTNSTNNIDFEGLGSIIDNLIENLGSSSDTVGGFLNAFQTLIGFIDNDAATSFEDFLNGIRGLGAEVLGPELLAQLTQIAGADLSTQAGRDQLRALLITLMESIFAGGSPLLGSVSPEDLQRIIETLVGFVDQADSEAVKDGGLLGDEITSRSVQIGRAINEVQANEVVAFLEDHGFTLREIRDLIREGNRLQLAIMAVNIGRGSFGGIGASFDFRGAQFGVVTPDLVRAYSAAMGAELLKASSNIARTSASFSGRQ